MRFQWQTEDENDERWQEPPARTPAPSVNRRRRGVAVLLFLCLAGVVGYLVYRQGQERIAERVSRWREDVRTSHRLGGQAVDQGDLEIFANILSGRDEAWVKIQKERLRRGLLYEQTPRVFGLVPVAADRTVAEVTFSADLREATVTSRHDYVLRGDPTGETVTLTQTAVYRRGTSRWLLAPPAEADFWGNWRTRERAYLSLTYPRRDGAVARRLSRDLDQKVAEMCSRLQCPPDFHVQLRLERSPQSLLALSDPSQSLHAGRALTLPAPTLVGLPVDDAAYQALFRGYARQLLSALLLNLGEWTCCDHALFHQALLYRQLAALDLASEPVSAADYLSLRDQLPELAQLRRWAWDGDPVTDPAEIPVPVYAFLEFLLERQGADLFRFRPSLEPALREWMLDSGRSPDRTERDQEWVHFLRTLPQRAQAELPMPPGLTLPEQDILLACQPRAEGPEATAGGTAADFTLYRYHHSAQQWAPEIESGPEFMLLTVLPDDNGFFLSEMATGESALQIDTYFQRLGADPVLVAGAARHQQALLAWPWSDPTGDRLLALVFDQDEPQGFPAFGLIDPERCTDQGCPYQPLPGYPVWSPDGRQMLAMSVEDTTIHRRAISGKSWQEVGKGAAPFWLDNQTYGFLRDDGIWVATVGEDQPSLWLTPAMHDEARAPAAPRPILSFDTALRHPLAAERFLLIASTASNQSELYLFGREDAKDTWSQSTPFIRHLATLPARIDDIPPLEGIVAAGRRWLVLPNSGAESGLWIYDLETEETLLSLAGGDAPSFPLAFDWSANGIWLARPATDAVELIAPDFRVDGRPYRRFIFHDLGRCTAAGWLNPG